jgi:hypothetical protein
LQCLSNDEGLGPWCVCPVTKSHASLTIISVVCVYSCICWTVDIPRGPWRLFVGKIRSVLQQDCQELIRNIKQSQL